MDDRRHRPLRRNQLIDRVEVLSKVKSLFLIPGIEMMSTKMVADFFEVSLNTLNTTYRRNKEEIDADGVIKLKVVDIRKKYLVQNERDKIVMKEVKGKAGFMTLDFDGRIVEFPNAGSNYFSPRAVLRIGMLLRDSEVAKEVRTQLLNNSSVSRSLYTYCTESFPFV